MKKFTKKRLLFLILGILLVLGLAACRNRDESETASVQGSENRTVSESTENAANQENVPTAFDHAQMQTESPEMPASILVEGETGAGETEESSVLVAYFSRSGNTEAVAEMIAEQTGGVLFEIVPEEPYPEDYDETVERFRQERSEDARPAVASYIDNMEDYNTVFVGYPIWGGDVPYVVRTFLEQYDFEGKNIVPFCTHGGSRFGSSLGTLEQLCQEADILEGYETSGNGQMEEISQWIEELGIQS